MVCIEGPCCEGTGGLGEAGEDSVSSLTLHLSLVDGGARKRGTPAHLQLGAELSRRLNAERLGLGGHVVTGGGTLLAADLGLEHGALLGATFLVLGSCCGDQGSGK